MIVFVIRNEWFEFEFFYLLLFSSALTEKSLIFLLLLCHTARICDYFMYTERYTAEKEQKRCAFRASPM